MPDAAVKTVLAFDFGLRRIGIASGDTVARTAAPRTAVSAGVAGPDWDAIARVLLGARAGSAGGASKRRTSTARPPR